MTSQPAEPTRARRAAAYMLGVLLLAYVLAFVDRQILNLLVGPLKRDLHISDFQVSLLQGPAFALFLSLAGLPIGRLVDVRGRTGVLGAGVGFWSLATVACGLAPGYPALLLSRIGVGAGEATMTPTAYSLIGDLFPPKRIGAAIGIYSMGPYLGGGLALIGGGALLAALPNALMTLPLLGPIAPWRVAFLFVGAVGLPVALWVSTLREPARRQAGADPPSWRETAGFFRSRAAAIGGINGAVVFAAMTTYALSAWIPSTLIRRFGMSPAQAGRDFGIIVLAAGMAGALSAGLIGDALRRRGWLDGRLRVLAVATALAIPFAAAAPVAASPALTLSLLAPLVFLSTLAVSCGPAALQEITPNRLRGVQHATAVLAVNLFGLGIGPPLVALVTDLGFNDERRVGTALAMTTPAMLGLAMIFALAAAPPYRRAVTAN